MIIKEKDIGKYLKKFKNLGIYIRLRGSINGDFVIHKLKYEIENDILKLKDKIAQNWLTINLNQSSKAQVSEDFRKIELQLDEDVDITIIIEN